MAYKAPLIGRLLRIITPEEINELVTTVDEGQKYPLTELIEQRQGPPQKEGPQQESSKAVTAQGPPAVATHLPRAKANFKEAIHCYRKSVGLGGGAPGEGDEGNQTTGRFGVLVNKRQS